MKMSMFSAAVVVKDAQRAKRFYRDKLGLKVLSDEDHWVTVGQPRGGSQLHLCEMTPLEKGNTGIVFAVDEKIDKAYQALRKKGVKFSVKPTMHEWGAECRFLDPDGNEFWLMGK